MDRVFFINKPIGYTSQDLVSKTKKILNIKKVGHTGTLDPCATGLMMVLTGKATKIAKYFEGHNKTYIATLQLGKSTETGDSEGKIVEEKSIDEALLTNDNIRRVLKTFEGEIEQTPPKYSAIKVDGKKLYEYARKNIDVEIPKRTIRVFYIELLSVDIANKQIIFEIKCSKGTYIRSVCEDIAKKLNTVGYMKALIRTKIDSFSVDNAVFLEELEENKDNKEWIAKKSFLAEDILSYFPKYYILERNYPLFLNGTLLDVELEDGIYNIYIHEMYVGTGIVKNKQLKRDVIFV